MVIKVETIVSAYKIRLTDLWIAPLFLWAKPPYGHTGVDWALWFWYLYYRCYFMFLCKVIWRIKPLAVWTQRRNAKAASVWLSKPYRASFLLCNEEVDEVNRSPNRH